MVVRESVPGDAVSTSNLPSSLTHGSTIHSRCSGRCQMTSSAAWLVPSRCRASSPTPVASVKAPEPAVSACGYRQ